MPQRAFRANEVSAGGVVVRVADAGYEICLISDGRYWGFPKGNVERGESPEQAARREISEETGIAAAALRLHGELAASEYVYRRAGRLIFKRVHQFLFEAPAGTELVPDPAEIADAAWLTFNRARELASFGDTRTALDAAERVLGDHAVEG